VSDDGTVGLAHRRLAIIDLSPGGHQPMGLCEAPLQIVFNGQIYNHREIREELEAAGHCFRTDSDTEVLLRAYLEHGTEVCSRLRGMYAFAVYDGRDKSLFLARDPFGIKPLYLWQSGSRRWFSSQVKALIAAGLPTTPSAAGHAGFLLWGHVPAGRTLYHEVTELAAGTWTKLWADGRSESGTHFAVVDEIAHPRLAAPRSSVEAKEALDHALRQSVRRHFVSDVPVSLFLSSGRDSSTLCALAQEATGQTLAAVTLAFREYLGTGWDETALAVDVAELYGADHTVTQLGAEDFESNRDELIASMDQPSVDGVNTFFVSKVTREAGFKVALSGLGADEIFQGYSSFVTVPRLARAAAIASAIPGFGRAVRNVASHLLDGRSSPKYAGLIEIGGSYGGAYLLRRGLFMPWELPKLMGPDLAEAGLAELDPVGEVNRTIHCLTSPIKRMVALESMLYMMPRLLRDSDWASMHHSLEIRVPFVEVDLFRTVVAALGTGHDYTKADLASSPRVALPEAILTRPKTGFMVPVHSWLRGARSHKGDNSLRGWALELYRQFGV
jgi:asparagine synthase (glutamine-hydrolysing)